jgi:RNA polymerase sigma-70 factor (ECF subfamily)
MSTLLTENTIQPDFDSVYEQYRSAMRIYLFHLVSDHELANDLTQDTFLRAWRAIYLHHVPVAASHMSAYLYRIATNVAYDALRRRKLIRWNSLDDLEYEPVDDLGDDPQAHYNGPAESIALALELMPAAYRSALLLYLQEGYSYAQIAQTLSIAPKGVKMFLTRARRRFRQHYTELESAYV